MGIILKITIVLVHLFAYCETSHDDACICTGNVCTGCTCSKYTNFIINPMPVSCTSINDVYRFKI